MGVLGMLMMRKASLFYLCSALFLAFSVSGEEAGLLCSDSSWVVLSFKLFKLVFNKQMHEREA